MLLLNFKSVLYFLILLFLIGVKTKVFANVHSPTISSTVLIEKENGTWILQLRASLTAFEQEVHNRYGRDSYKTPKAFKNMMKNIFKENIHLSFGHSLIVLENPKIILGHETIVVYEFRKNENWKSLSIKNSTFKNIDNSKNVFFVSKKGIIKNQFTLNKKNNFKAIIKVKGKLLVLSP